MHSLVSHLHTEAADSRAAQALGTSRCDFSITPQLAPTFPRAPITVPNDGIFMQWPYIVVLQPGRHLARRHSEQFHGRGGGLSHEVMYLLISRVPPFSLGRGRPLSRTVRTV